MAGFTDYTEGKILDHIFGDTVWTVPSPLYLGALSGTESSDAGGGLTEVSTSGTGYARLSTEAADWAAVTGTAPVTKSNSAVKSFATATADWAGGANITHVGLYDAASSGNLLCVYKLAGTGKPVLAGDTPSIAAGALVTKLGDPGDTY